jgi:hypothetical protein
MIYHQDLIESGMESTAISASVVRSVRIGFTSEEFRRSRQVRSEWKVR